ncbi:hypothetical protein HF521_006805, partial [Silurus meridionalis]
CMSSLTTSINLLLSLPLYLFLGGSIFSILLPISPKSHFCTCLNHLNLASLTLSSKCPTCVALGILVTPNENLNIFNSATSSSAFCLLVNATVSKPYNKTGLTTVL